MKKLIKILKWPLSIPALTLLLSYGYWFLVYPMDFDGTYDDNYSAFLFGIGLASVFSFFTLLLWFFRKNRFVFFLAFIVYLTTFIGSSVYTAMYFPRMVDKAELGKSKYYVIGTSDLDWHGFDSFYKCTEWSFDCDILYGSYGLTGTKIIVDEQQNEVSWFETGFQRLLVTDGENARGYIGLSAQLAKHVYQLSDICNEYNNDVSNHGCASTTYILYQCNLDHLACKPLPIQYTQSYDIYPYLVANEEKREISLYEDYEQKGETLIFTYGEHPRCYVEGCEILEP